jgi:signal peptidase I
MDSMFRRLGTFFLDIIEVVVMAVALFLFLYLLVLQPHKIKGASMHPNYPDGEYLLTEKVSYYFNGPSRGDVVVLKPPSQVSEDEFIKRVIGLPGEKISISDGKVYVNGQELNEPYLKNISTSGNSFLEEEKEIIVPADSYLVFGDNRPHSSDSRAWGYITKKQITGKAWIIYWPPSQAGLVKAPKYNF